MSKKKAFSGSTMTLKDFHGGSIPSDIPLPSAPGVIVRPTDRPGYDRQSSWGNPMGRSDHRLRPNSSGSIRNFDDKTPFLSNSAQIGRNFDEDERKPLDGLAGPRKSVIDDNIRSPPMLVEPKQDGGRFSGQQGSVSILQISGVNAGSYMGRVVQGDHMGISSRTQGSGSGGHAVTGSYPNVWTVRKEAVSVNETPSASWGGRSAVSKFAQASALDKVSSGRWQTKPVHQQADVEVIRHSELQGNLYTGENDFSSGVNMMKEGEYHETKLAMDAERGLTIEDRIRSGVKGLPATDRVRSPVSDAKERTSVSYSNGGLSGNPDNKYGNSELQVSTEALDRPKLKLLPRTKPLDMSEASILDPKQGFPWPSDAIHVETGSELHGGMSHSKAGHSGNEAGNQFFERPRLNLKPRSQPLQQSEENAERERNTLFGGARPRELVLMGRGVDEGVHVDEVVQTPSRTKNDVPRSETLHAFANPSRYGERAENLPPDYRTGRASENKDQRVDGDRADSQRKNWRNENWRNSRDAEHHHQRQQERRPSPKTWRKPVEQPKPDVSGLRYGKAVSAAELAQVFSKSVSEPRSTDQHSGQRGLPGRIQIPFSRLTGQATRPQINGY
ncbi:hypothetical protein Ancab_033676 [Ancistrocladus abbreviatus]